MNTDKERLDWLANYLQNSQRGIFCPHESEKKPHPDDTEETRWNNPYEIGISYETEHRGCYEWKSFSSGKKDIRKAIDEAMVNYDKWQEQIST